MSKPASTDHPVLDPIRQRWSPRAFADKPVDKADLASLFEAARWAASSYNEQPWRFLVATRDDRETFDKMLGCLVPGNQAWAGSAPVLVLTAFSTAFAHNGKDNRCAPHDLGQAAAHLALEATARGLYVHQMAGVDLERVREAYSLPEGFEPFTAIAIGHLGSPDTLPEKLRAPETAERQRKPLAELVFGGAWGKPAEL